MTSVSVPRRLWWYVISRRSIWRLRRLYQTPSTPVWRDE